MNEMRLRRVQCRAAHAKTRHGTTVRARVEEEKRQECARDVSEQIPSHSFRQCRPLIGRAADFACQNMTRFATPNSSAQLIHRDCTAHTPPLTSRVRR